MACAIQIRLYHRWHRSWYGIPVRGHYFVNILYWYWGYLGTMAIRIAHLDMGSIQIPYPPSWAITSRFHDIHTYGHQWTRRARWAPNGSLSKTLTSLHTSKVVQDRKAVCWRWGLGFRRTSFWKEHTANPEIISYCHRTNVTSVLGSTWIAIQRYPVASGSHRHMCPSSRTWVNGV